MSMEPCIFCRIVAREIPAAVVYEDDDTLAFLDVHPRAPGHVMVIPKIHAETIVGLSDGDVAAVFRTVKKVAARVQDVLGAAGLTIGMNHGAASGQTVPHLHVHIIPRFKGDNGGSIHSIVHTPSSESIDVLREKISLH